MLRNIWLETTLFDPADDTDRTEIDLMWLLTALSVRNVDYLRQRPQTPRLYKSGVVWEAPRQFTEGDCEEVAVLRKALGKTMRQGDVRRALDKVQGVMGGEHFCDIGVILELGAIDCDGIACWRVAELRQAGIPARPYLTGRRRSNGTTYHALVLWPPLGPECPHATTEDPSLLLGMHQPDRAADRQEEIRKNAERCQILQRRGLVPAYTLEDVLGLRMHQRARQAPQQQPRRVSPIVAEIDRILRSAA